MNARWHKAVAGLGLALAGALLSGCHAQGTFDVLSEDRVAVDLFVSGADVNCPNSADALKLTVTTTVDQYGDQVCHVTGETQATYFSPFGITVSPAAEYLVFEANLSGGIDSWPTADIDIRFPGKVMDASLGTFSDNVVRITDLGALTQGSGLRAVGLASPGPPQWLIAALAGTGAGILATLVAVLAVVLVRRPRRQAPALDHDAAGETVPEIATFGPDPVPVVAPVEPVRATSAGPPPPPPPADDTSWFAQPPGASVPMNGKATNGAVTYETVTYEAVTNEAASPEGPRSPSSLQHSAWARPPESSGDQTAG